MSLTLYRRENCHLCELAVDALLAAGVGEFESVDIGWDGALAERYGERVPVLRRGGPEAELNWPFDAWSVRRFLAA